ncbi:MAG TPA: hypothetical protein VJ875_13865 [Pyrinomonadaceae bacterium]|nr:hypothetical protein [Pyrinomonadaceae bacterium]
MAKQISRKGAKPQRNVKSSFASLRLCVSTLCLLAVISPSVLSQTKSARFDPDGSFWIVGTPPTEFSDFSAINLNAKKLRRLPPTGLQTNNGKTYRFKTFTVKRDNFTFTTVTVDGVSYSFAGKFLKGGNFAATWLGDESPVLEGTLTKFRAGKKLAEAKLKFSYFGGT